MSQSQVIEELHKDLEELLSIQKTAQRKRVQDLLNADISKLKTTIEIEKNRLPQPIPKEETKIDDRPSQTITIGEKTEEFVPIMNYSWDQEGKNVKIYLTLQNIGQVDKDSLKFEVTDQSVDIKIYGYQNKNHRFSVKKLNGSIDTSASKYSQKNNTVIITLKKKSSDHWDQLYYKDKPFKAEKKPEVPEDPQAGLMNMMKKLYEEGDDDMKRTIAQAWTKSQDEKGKAPSK